MTIQVFTPILDNIVFLLDWDIDPRTDAKNFRKLQDRLQLLVDSCDCEMAHIKGSRYYTRFRILLPSGHEPLIQLGTFDKQRNKGGVRVELNPSRLQAGDVKQLRRVLRRVLGISDQQLRELFAAAVLNKLHVAVDVYGADLSRLLVTYQHAEKLTVFGKRLGKAVRVEGYNFGARSSNYQAAVYDKKTERVHQAVMALLRAGRSADESLKANKVTQFYDAQGAPNRMRVEVRGQKMRGLPLYKAKTLTNRFGRFAFTDLDVKGSVLPPVLQQAFISMCRDIGAGAALKQFKGSKQARKINAFWRSRQATWWKPNDMWDQVEGLLRATELFPKEAFDEPS